MESQMDELPSISALLVKMACQPTIAPDDFATASADDISKALVGALTAYGTLFISETDESAAFIHTPQLEEAITLVQRHVDAARHSVHLHHFTMDNDVMQVWARIRRWIEDEKAEDDDWLLICHLTESLLYILVGLPFLVSHSHLPLARF
jgi:hypothetical protein